MRNHAKICPSFWSGETGRFLRDAGPDAQRVALYLMTAPSSNMIGLYYLPLPTLCHEVGISEEGALKALQRASEGEFARYDRTTETVYVLNMAKYQVGPNLQPRDNQVKAVASQLHEMRKSPFAKDFWQKHHESYHLPRMTFPKPLQRPSEAPSKALRSQEKEKDKEKEKEEEEEGVISLSKKREKLTIFDDGRKLGIYDLQSITTAHDHGWTDQAIRSLFAEYQRRVGYWSDDIRNPIAVLVRWLQVLQPDDPIPWPRGEPPAKPLRARRQTRTELDKARMIYDQAVRNWFEEPSDQRPGLEQRDALIAAKLRARGFSNATITQTIGD